MRVVKEQVIGIKSPWTIRARIVSYHGDKVRRTEVMLEKVDKIPYQDEVGWTVEELQHLQNLLVEWKQKQGEK